MFRQQMFHYGSDSIISQTIYVNQEKQRSSEPCGTPALVLSYSDVYPFRTTLWNLFDRKFLTSSNKSPEIPKDLILNIKPGDQILLNALDTSKNTVRVSFGESRSKFGKFHDL